MPGEVVEERGHTCCIEKAKEHEVARLDVGNDVVERWSLHDDRVGRAVECSNNGVMPVMPHVEDLDTTHERVRTVAVGDLVVLAFLRCHLSLSLIIECSNCETKKV